MRRKKHLNVSFIQILFAFLLSCSSNGSSNSANSKEQKINQKPTEETELLIQRWKLDSLGCHKTRNKAVSETIIDNLELKNTDKIKFLEVFGKPNIENEREGGIILSYYFDALCANGRVIDSFDYCIAEFTFKQNKLTQRNYLCH